MGNPESQTPHEACQVGHCHLERIDPPILILETWWWGLFTSKVDLLLNKYDDYSRRMMQKLNS